METIIVKGFVNDTRKINLNSRIIYEVFLETKEGKIKLFKSIRQDNEMNLKRHNLLFNESFDSIKLDDMVEVVCTEINGAIGSMLFVNKVVSKQDLVFEFIKNKMLQEGF